MNQNAGVISKSTTNERIAECRATLERIGLGNYQAEFHVHPWQFKETYVVCDLKGQAIICRNRWADHIAESFNQIHGQSIEPMVLRKPDNSITVFIMQRTITLPERHTLKSFTQYFDRFYPGFQADSEYVTFPKATRAYGTPCEFEREEDAYEAAEVLGVVTGFNTDVFETTTGYTAVIYDDSENLIDYNAIAVLGPAWCCKSFRVPANRNRKQIPTAAGMTPLHGKNELVKSTHNKNALSLVLIGCWPS
ncbi:MAG: hypothetical protein LUE17_12115 [Planctomycetaceae bacterium]|nr:hypothetical protein [Planctomycetaceae bacterium]